MTKDSAISSLPLSTPMDIRLNITKLANVAHPLRWGIIGAGSISDQWVRCLHECEGATVTAVAARSADRAKEFATKHGITSAYSSYAEMVVALVALDVDIVYVGKITRLHKEHSLLAIEAGTIGEVLMTQSDFFDPIYAIQAAPLAFGAQVTPTAITAAGQKASGAIVEYGDDKCAILTFPPFNSELAEVTEFIGTKGRITLEQPGHCPTRITIRIPPPNGVPSRYRTANAPAPTQHFEYPLPAAVRIPKASPNQQGFLCQAQTIHRCLASGLRECPQYNQEESLHAMDLLTKINEVKQAIAQQ